jgi:hypothetical protein
MEAEMRVIPPILAGSMALAAASVQAARSPNENWRPLSTVLSFELTEDEACGYGAHQILRRDWRGVWWWGPCIPKNK